MNIKTKLTIAGIGNFIDAIATYILTQYYGFAELNPIMAWLLQWPELAVIFKIIFITSLLIYARYTKRQEYMNAFATFAACVYGFMGIYYTAILPLCYLLNTYT